MNGVASCAKTCLSYLRYDGSLEEMSPPNDDKCVNWYKVLLIKFPGAVIHHFNKGKELVNLTSETLDRLIVGTMNKTQDRSNHAMVIFKCQLEVGHKNKKLELFNPAGTHRDA